MISFYPPVLESSRKAFLVGGNLTINFQIPYTVASDDVHHIDARVIRQRDNKNLVDLDKYPDGIIYKEYQGNKYFIIQTSDLTEEWTAGELYKIQLRFGGTILWDGYYQNPQTTSGFSTWKEEQITQNTLGEWSNVMVTKAIEVPVLDTGPLATNIAKPTFYGNCSSPSDPESEFFFQIIDENNEMVVESNWIQHTEDQDLWETPVALEEELSYNIKYKIKTRNGYESDFISTKFEIFSSPAFPIGGVTVHADTNWEDGYNEISIELDDNIELTGNYIISRTKDGTNWNDLQYYFFLHETPKIVYRDYCIESGEDYQYGFQFENRYHLRSDRNLSEIVQCNFQHSYLYADGVQLKLEFNNSMNTFKHSVLSSKQDTIGSRYPTILRNGYAYYGEFPVNGLISLHQDEGQTFFKWVDREGLYCGDRLIAPYSKFEERGGVRESSDGPAAASYLSIDGSISTDLTNENIFIERKVRESIESWLNNGEYKLFKSPTEGTMIVTLINVTMQPNQTLGRMIYSFTSTAYEIAEFSVKNLNDLGIINIGSCHTPEQKTKVYERLGSLNIAGAQQDILNSIQATCGDNERFGELEEIIFESQSPDYTMVSIGYTSGSSENVFIAPRRSYQIDALDGVNSIVLETETSLIVRYKYNYTLVTPPTDMEVIYISLKDVFYQAVQDSNAHLENSYIVPEGNETVENYILILDSSSTSDGIVSFSGASETNELVQLVLDNLLGVLQRTSFYDGVSGSSISGSSLQQVQGSGSLDYINHDGTLIVRYLFIEKLDIEDAPVNTLATIGLENGGVVEIDLGASGTRTFYPYRDGISTIRVPEYVLSNLIIRAKVSLVYEVLAEVEAL